MCSTCKRLRCGQLSIYGDSVLTVRHFSAGTFIGGGSLYIIQCLFLSPLKQHGGQTQGGIQECSAPSHPISGPEKDRDCTPRPCLPLAACPYTHTHTCHPITTASMASISTVSKDWRPRTGSSKEVFLISCSLLPLPPYSTPGRPLPSSLPVAEKNKQ